MTIRRAHLYILAGLAITAGYDLGARLHPQPEKPIPVGHGTALIVRSTTP